MPSGMLSGAGAAALAGAAAGAALTAAEAVCARLTGAPLPPSLLVFLAAHYVPVGAAAAAAAELLGRRRGPPASSADRALIWMLPTLAVVYAVAVANQNLLRGGGWSAGSRVLASALAAGVVAAAAVLQERSSAGPGTQGPPARASFRLAMLAVFLVVLHLALPALAALPPVAAAALLPLAAVLVTGMAAALVARAPRALALLGGAAVLAVLAASPARRGLARDAPQPEAGANARWLEGKPSVVLVVLDTVRSANVSSYGYARRTTPHLDALAANGVRYAAATSPGSWSVSAHASLFTGLHPRQHGAGRWRGGEHHGAPLDERYLTLAETLSAQGYATAGISANPVVSAAFGLDQGFRYYDAGRSSTVGSRYSPLLRRVQHWLPRALSAHLRDRFAKAYLDGSGITDEALHWLASRRPPGRPFLLFVNYMDVHTPLFPRPGYTDRWPGAPPSRLSDDDVWPRPPEQRDALVRLYDGALLYLDEQVGRLLAGIQALPDAERVWTIVTSDHGEALGEHGRVGHDCDLHEELLRVPLIMRYPRGMGPPPGTVDDEPMPLTEVTPLVLVGLGLRPSDPVAPRSGRSVLATADCACAHLHPDLHGEELEAVRLDGLKYVEEAGRAPRLFDLRRDPGETADVRAQRPEDAARLKAELERWRRLLVSPPLPPSDGPGAREREEALRALGYVR